MIENSPFELSCPKCRGAVQREDMRARCPSCKSEYPFTDGIWRFLSQKRAEHFAKFREQYTAIRREGGWGSDNAEYYRRLPLVPRGDPRRNTWWIRERNFKRLLQLIGDTRPLKILDSGAGNGWLSNQLARRGHTIAAVDLSDDKFDGLGAAIHYSVAFARYQADFDSLPFFDGQFDLAVWNGSFHYAHDLSQAIGESLRVLNAAGTVIVMDSPVYHERASGKAMLAQKARDLHLDIGGDQVGFLTFDDFDYLAMRFSLHWRWIEPFVDLRWATRHWLARWRGQREPARFGLMIGARR